MDIRGYFKKSAGKSAASKETTTNKDDTNKSSESKSSNLKSSSSESDLSKSLLSDSSPDEDDKKVAASLSSTKCIKPPPSFKPPPSSSISESHLSHLTAEEFKVPVEYFDINNLPQSKIYFEDYDSDGSAEYDEIKDLSDDPFVNYYDKILHGGSTDMGDVTKLGYHEKLFGTIKATPEEIEEFKRKNNPPSPEPFSPLKPAPPVDSSYNPGLQSSPPKSAVVDDQIITRAILDAGITTRTTLRMHQTVKDTVGEDHPSTKVLNEEVGIKVLGRFQREKNLSDEKLGLSKTVVNKNNPWEMMGVNEYIKKSPPNLTKAKGSKEWAKARNELKELVKNYKHQRVVPDEFYEAIRGTHLQGICAQMISVWYNESVSLFESVEEMCEVFVFLLSSESINPFILSKGNIYNILWWCNELGMGINELTKREDMTFIMEKYGSNTITIEKGDDIDRRFQVCNYPPGQFPTKDDWSLQKLRKIIRANDAVDKDHSINLQKDERLVEFKTDDTSKLTLCKHGYLSKGADFESNRKHVATTHGRFLTITTGTKSGTQTAGIRKSVVTNVKIKQIQQGKNDMGYKIVHTPIPNKVAHVLSLVSTFPGIKIDKAKKETIDHLGRHRTHNMARCLAVVDLSAQSTNRDNLKSGVLGVFKESTNSYKAQLTTNGKTLAVTSPSEMQAIAERRMMEMYVFMKRWTEDVGDLDAKPAATKKRKAPNDPE